MVFVPLTCALLVCPAGAWCVRGVQPSHSGDKRRAAAPEGMGFAAPCLQRNPLSKAVFSEMVL